MKSHFFRQHLYIEIAVGRIACGEPVSTRLECHICLISIQTSGTSMFEQTEVYQNRFRMTNQPDVDTLIPDFSGINDPRFSISLENTGEK